MNPDFDWSCAEWSLAVAQPYESKVCRSEYSLHDANPNDENNMPLQAHCKGYFATYQRFFLPQSLDAEGRRKVFTSVDAFTLQHAIEWANSNPLCFLDACNVCIKNDVAFERSNHFRSRVRRAWPLSKRKCRTACAVTHMKWGRGLLGTLFSCSSNALAPVLSLTHRLKLCKRIETCLYRTWRKTYDFHLLRRGMWNSV